MGQLLVPAMIGAGVGAVGGAVTGRNPFKSALLGGALGAGGAGLMGAGGAGAAAGTAGTGAGSGLIGGANLSTAGGLGIGSGATGGLGGLGNFLSSIKGVETTPVSLGTGGYVSGIGGQIIPEVVANTVAPAIAQTATQNFIPQHLIGNSTGMANYIPGGPFMPGDVSNFVENTPYMPGASAVTSAPNFTPVLGKSAGATGGGYDPSFFGRVGDMIGNPFGDLTARDKLGLGLQGANMLNQPQQMIQPSQGQISRPQFDPSSTLINVSPNVRPMPGSEVGLMDMQTTMPLTDEELLRLQQLLQTTGFRGR